MSLCFHFKNVVTLVLVVISHVYAQYCRTALHEAAVAGHHEICQCLIEHGASLDIRDVVRDNLYQEYALYKL